MKKKSFTRREFLKSSAVATVGGVLYLNLPAQSIAPESKNKSKVILVRNKNVIDNNYKVDPVVIGDMLDDAVRTLVGQKETAAAWKELIKPNDKIGIKTNVWTRLRTPLELEAAIKKRVMECGVQEANIGIDDRGVLNDPVFQQATGLINVRPLRTHHWSGVGSLIKNYITFAEDKPAYHPDSCADLAKLWTLPEVKDKTRLNILVMLTPLFHGVGPHHFSPEYIWAYNGILVGFDPVAVDSVGVSILQAKRHQYFGEERPISPPAKHVMLADTRHHLGTADPDSIDLIRIGMEEDSLI